MLEYKTQKVIDVDDWDSLVEETYGRPYNFQQQDGCKERQQVAIIIPDEYVYDYENDSIPEEVNGEEMGVSFKAWLERSPSQGLGGNPYHDFDVRLFWERNFYPAVEMIGNDLYARGLVEAGDYVIDIDW